MKFNIRFRTNIYIDYDVYDIKGEDENDTVDRAVEEAELAVARRLEGLAKMGGYDDLEVYVVEEDGE